MAVLEYPVCLNGELEEQNKTLGGRCIAYLCNECGKDILLLGDEYKMQNHDNQWVKAEPITWSGFRDQYVFCKHFGHAKVEKCPQCGREVVTCHRIGGFCHSSKCRPVREELRKEREAHVRDDKEDSDILPQ